MIAIVVAIAGHGVVSVADGWYDLTVAVGASTATGIERISYMPVRGERKAKEITTKSDDYLEFMKHQESVASFVIRVGYSFRVSAWGYASEESQEYSHVVVLVHRRNGTREIHLLEIPHRNETRSILVSSKSRIATDTDISNEL